MNISERDTLLSHLDSQARLLSAKATVARLDDSKTDLLLPEIRDQLAMMNETLDTLGGD